MTFQNVWDAVKVVLQGKFMAINTYVRKETVSNQQSKHPPQENRKTRAK